MPNAALPLNARILGPILCHVRPAWLASWAKRAAGIKRFVVTVDNGSFFIDPVSHFGQRLIHDRAYEPGMEAVLRHFLKPGDTFVDVGANEGYFSILASRLVGPHGRVIAIEPQSRLRPIIGENARLNDCRNLTLISAAVSDRPGSAELHLSPDTNTGGSGLTRVTRYRVETESISTQTLSQILSSAGVRQVELIKIDIEGFEYEAVLGSMDVFTSGIVRAIALELHPEIIRNRGLDPDRIAATLRDSGYRQEQFNGNTVFVSTASNGPTPE